MSSANTAVWTQVVILFLTTAVIVWYTIETHRLRNEMVRQNAISLRPMVLPQFAGAHPQRSFRLKNCGVGCALNVRISPIPIIEADNFGLGPAEVRFEQAYYMAVGEDIPTPVRIWAGGQPAERSPFDNWFFPQYPGGEVKFEISFEDVEGGAYSIPVMILAQNDQRKLPREVKIGAVRKIQSRS
jgi:hypothetical protein